MQKIIQKTKEHLYNHLSSKYEDVHDIKYRYEHSLRVANIGLEIAEVEEANKKVVVLGCLLHDLGKFDSEKGVDHGRVSAKLARPFLETLSLSAKEVDDICYAIATHVDGKAGYDYEETLEAKIVTDADNIDRFSACKIRQSKLWDLRDERPIEDKIRDYEALVSKWANYLDKDVLETRHGSHLFRDKARLSHDFYKTLVEDMKLTVEPKWS